MSTKALRLSARNYADEHRPEPIGKRIYKGRKEPVERSFASAKQPHGHRYARMRGLVKAQRQCLLASIKKIALLLGRTPENAPFTTLYTACRVCRQAL